MSSASHFSSQTCETWSLICYEVTELFGNWCPTMGNEGGGLESCFDFVKRRDVCFTKGIGVLVKVTPCQSFAGDALSTHVDLHHVEIRRRLHCLSFWWATTVSSCLSMYLSLSLSLFSLRFPNFLCARKRGPGSPPAWSRRRKILPTHCLGAQALPSARSLRHHHLQRHATPCNVKTKPS